MAPDSFATTGAIHSRADGASLINVESSKLLPWLMFCSILSGIALATSLFVMMDYRAQLFRNEREYRLLELQVQDQSAIMIREGLKRPSDQINGPTFDPHRK